METTGIVGVTGEYIFERVYGFCQGKMENQIEQKMENEMETGIAG